jgi:hypothetical protein
VVYHASKGLKFVIVCLGPISALTPVTASTIIIMHHLYPIISLIALISSVEGQPPPPPPPPPAPANATATAANEVLLLLPTSLDALAYFVTESAASAAAAAEGNATVESPPPPLPPQPPPAPGPVVVRRALFSDDPLAPRCLNLSSVFNWETVSGQRSFCAPLKCRGRVRTAFSLPLLPAVCGNGNGNGNGAPCALNQTALILGLGRGSNPAAVNSSSAFSGDPSVQVRWEEKKRPSRLSHPSP